MSELVVFLHSTGTLPSMWKHVPPAALRGRERLLALHRGYPPGPLLSRGEVCDATNDAEHVLAQLPASADRIHLVAHSYGGLVAVKLLERLGARVESAFLFEPVMFGSLRHDAQSDPDGVAQAREFAENPWFVFDPDKGGTDEWMELFIDYWNRPGSWRAMPDAARAQTLSFGWKMFQEVRSCFFDETPFAQVKLPADTTLVMGQRSPPASRAMAVALKRENPGAVLVDLEGAGHMAPLTQPGLVHPELSKHFARLDGDAT